MLSKKDFEAMAKGEAADAKNEHYPEWKKEDFVKVLEALKDINETKNETKKMENFDLKKFLVENKLTTNSKTLSVNEEMGAPVSKTKTVNAKLASGADMGTRPASALGMIGTVKIGGQDYEVKAFQGKTSPAYTLIGHESFSENMGMPFWKYFMKKLQDLNGGKEVMFTPAEDVMIQEPTLDPQ